jgi:hypothetical protein
VYTKRDGKFRHYDSFSTQATVCTAAKRTAKVVSIHTTISSASGPMLTHWPRDLQMHAVLGGAGELLIEAVHTPHQGNGSGTVPLWRRECSILVASSLVPVIGGTKIAECSCVQCARM